VKIKTDEIASVIKQEIEQFSAELEISEVGRVVEIGDGIARIYGLAKAMAGELVEFETSEGAVMGQVMNLEEDTVGCVIYGNYLSVREGDVVKSTGRLLEVPVGEALLGRVVDPWAGRSTTARRSRPPRRPRSTSSPRASPSASRCTSRSRPASRPSTR
jgi:F-type H+/Na+-transporting ATPase subunit alpha